MFHSRAVKRAIIFSAFIVLVDNLAHAELIVEIHSVGGCFDCIPNGMNYGFSVVEPKEPGRPSPTATWTLFATASQVGETFSAPAEVLPGFNQVLTTPNSIAFNLHCCGSNGLTLSSPPRLNQSTIGEDIVTVTRIAPNLGPNLFGYQISEITQTVDELTFEQVGSNLFRGNGSHTVRIYGIPIPEPTTFSTAIILLILFNHKSRIRLPRI